MKKLLAKLLVALLICALAFTAFGCRQSNEEENPPITDGGSGNTTKPDDKPGDNKPTIDKTALNAELALEVTEQGDYTTDSYNAYAAKLAAAKAVASDTEATQAAVDQAAAELTAARQALAVRPVEEVEGANKSFRLISGNSLVITLADYVDANELSNMTYEVKADNAVLVVSAIADGKVTLTADEVREATTVKVTIKALYKGEQKLAVELSVVITNDKAPVLKADAVSKNYDLFDLANKESLVIDFAENVDNSGNIELRYLVKFDLENEPIEINTNTYTFDFGTYTDEEVNYSFKVYVYFTANGEAGSLSYTYKLGLKDTSAYRVANGNFENGVADGWTASESFGAIDDRSIFWSQEFPMFNVGKYFSSESSNNMGSLASPLFTAKGKYATFMLGAAGKEKVYVTIEDADGNVLALYRNTKFADLPAGVEDWDEQRALIGVSVFTLNFVTYKVDISAYEGQNIRFVIHDQEDGNGGFGFVLFDELNTYYASESEVPENAVLVENLLAKKDALNAELALEVTAQGDYTDASYNAYLEKLAAAKALADDVAATQAKVDAATAALIEARQALAVRPVLEVEGATKSFKLISGNEKEIDIANYVNANNLSNITYVVNSSNAAATLSAIVDGKFTITAGNVTGTTEATVSIIVSYNGVEKLTVELTVTITNDVAPTVKGNEIVKKYDLYALENKTDIALDLSENINNDGNLALTYSVDGTVVDGSSYTFTFGSYGEEVNYTLLTVTVSYTANGEAGSLEYTYKLGLKDTSAYRLVNGGFESGMDGWTKEGNVGDVSDKTHYWENDPDRAEGYAFGMDGEKMFSAYATNDEAACGTLTSSPFVVSSNRVITFKLGAAKHDVFVEIVDAETGDVYARYGNSAWRADKDAACALHAYKAVLPEAAAGKTVYIRIVDNATGDYGLFFCDSFVTYYDEVPADGYVDAIDIANKYVVVNGSFESGNLYGWTMNITAAGGQNTLGWVVESEIGDKRDEPNWYTKNDDIKDGRFLFTFAKREGEEGHINCENTKGTLTSSTFILKKDSYLSFKFGGAGVAQNHEVYIELRKADGSLIATFYNHVEGKINTKMNAYYYQYAGDETECYFRVVDNSISNYGCFVVDDFRVNLDAAPEGFINAKDLMKYEVANGSFESGNLDGWTADNGIGVVTDRENPDGWYTRNDETKNGSYLFTFAPEGENYESGMGVLTSSVFTLKKDTFVSFKFGGAGGADGQPLVIDTVYVQLCRADDNSVIATFYNDAEGKVNTKMNAYCYQYTGETTDCYFKVVDNATGNYGCFVVDDFRANLTNKPDGFIQK